MNLRNQRGLTLIELMVALVLGLIIVLGVTQTFISAKNTYLTQNASSAMQEDARYLLSRMSQEIRMTGMFGCLNETTPPSNNPTPFTDAKAMPVNWIVDGANGNRLVLITADVGAAGTAPTWTIVTDCKNSAQAFEGTPVVPVGQIAFPLRQVTYSFRNNQIWTGAPGGQQALINNVFDFQVRFGLAADDTGSMVTRYVTVVNKADMGKIRTLRLTLTLTDPANTTRNQTYSIVAALRNRLP